MASAFSNSLIPRLLALLLVGAGGVSASDYKRQHLEDLGDAPLAWSVSDNGRGYAYLAQRGENYVWVFKGEALLAGKVGADWRGCQSQDHAALSADGSSFAFKRRPLDTEPPGESVVVNGKQSPPYGFVGKLTFSPDGAHFAFLGIDGNESYVIIDRKSGDPLDPLEATWRQDLVFGPDRKTLGYAAKPRNGAGARAAYSSVFHDHQVVKQWTRQDIPISQVTFSEDWTHLAHVTVVDQGSRMERTRVLVDDHVVGEHNTTGSVGGLSFSPAGHLAYFAYGNNFFQGGARLYFGGSPLGPALVETGLEVYFPPRREKPHWFARQAQGGKWQLFAGGYPAEGGWDKIVPPVKGRQLAFSPSGSHYAYMAQEGGQYWLVVDGKARPSLHPNPLPCAGPVFDGEHSLHYLERSEAGVDLVCVATEQDGVPSCGRGGRP